MFGIVKKSTLIMCGSISLLIFVILGTVLLPVSYRIVGRGDRERGHCVVTGKQVAYISGRGGGAYRAVFGLTVYALGTNTSSTPYQTNAAGYTGDLSTECYFPGKGGNGAAQNTLNQFSAGTLYDCIYPPHASDFGTTGTGIYDSNVVFLGTYSDEEIERAKNKFRDMWISGIVFLCLAGGWGILFIGAIVTYSYKWDIKMWCLQRDMDSAMRDLDKE